METLVVDDPVTGHGCLRTYTYGDAQGAGGGTGELWGSARSASTSTRGCGDEHGVTSGLGPQEMSALVAFLQTL